MRKILLVIIFILIFFILGILGQAGFFNRIQITTTQAGPFLLVGQSYQGDYANSPVIMDTVFNQLQAAQIKTTRGFGVYFDNPKEIERDNLRSFLGNIVNPIHTEALQAFSQKLQITTFPSQDCLQVIFPYNSQLSVMAGIMKVYPAVMRYIQQNQLNRHAAIEIYDIPAKQIIYLFPLHPKRDMLDQFYVSPK